MRAKLTNMSATADRLAEAMELRGVDQSALARGVGVTQGAISKIVLGQTANSRLLPRLATYLDVSMPWLLGMADKPFDDESEERGLSCSERELLACYALLDPAQQSALLTIALAMAGRGAPGSVHAPRPTFVAEESVR